MIRLQVRFLAINSALALLFPVVLLSVNGRPALAQPPKSKNDDLAVQLKELQKQVAELQSRMGDSKTPRLLAAGTTTANISTSVRVKLDAGVAARLGDDAIVIVTTRGPVAGLPIFVPFWKPAKDGFDITLGDVTLEPNAVREYWGTKNRTFVVDWIVVKK